MTDLCNLEQNAGFYGAPEVFWLQNMFTELEPILAIVWINANSIYTKIVRLHCTGIS